mgnify:CR=1 FL=1
MKTKKNKERFFESFLKSVNLIFWFFPSQPFLHNRLLSFSSSSFSFFALLLQRVGPAAAEGTENNNNTLTSTQDGDAHPGLPGHDGRARAAADGDARRRGQGARRAEGERAEAYQDRPGEREEDERVSLSLSPSRCVACWREGSEKPGREKAELKKKTPPDQIRSLVVAVGEQNSNGRNRFHSLFVFFLRFFALDS